VLPPGTKLFGSVARGDVREASDIDLEVPHGAGSFAVEVALARVDETWNDRRLVQATPNAVVKALWDLGEVTVALPLTRPSPLEEAFARFGGALDAAGLRREERVPGIDKRLLLIEPTKAGHRESSVADRVEAAAKILHIDADVVRGRLRVLKRRATAGRTGVYLSRAVGEDESLEEALDALKDADPAVRRAASG
jgi:predicted nucleotidyltransferase